ncbi:MAG: EamA family transporter [Oscillospiraceae bacterium]|nr:EamA family transporter [Oscillospiraceae bacterium]
MDRTSKIMTNRLVVALCALLCCALWGSATPFIKIGYELILPVRNTASTILFAGVRFCFAGFLTVLIYSIGRRKVLYPKRENIKRILAVSVFQTILQYIFFYIGLANTSGVKGTVISSSNAFTAILIASLVFRTEKLSFKKIFACVLGFAGILLVNLDGLDFNMNFTGDCFVLFCAIASGFASVLSKRYSKYEDPIVISGYQFFFGGIVLIVLGLAAGGQIAVESFTAFSVLTYLAFLSAVAFGLWSLLLKYNPVSKISVYNFTTPICGVILSSLMLSENSMVSPVSLIFALVLVSSGIILLNRKKEV